MNSEILNIVSHRSTKPHQTDTTLLNKVDFVFRLLMLPNTVFVNCATYIFAGKNVGLLMSVVTLVICDH